MSFIITYGEDTRAIGISSVGYPAQMWEFAGCGDKELFSYYETKILTKLKKRRLPL